MIDYGSMASPKIQYFKERNMKLSIGIDVAKRKMDVAFCNSERIFLEKQYDNDAAGFRKLIEKIVSETGYDEKLATMEVTGIYHLKLAEALIKAGIKTSTVNPLIIKRYAQMKMRRAKTDKVDARVIAEYGMDEKPYEYKPKSEKEQDIEDIVKLIDDYKQIKTQITNRIEALINKPQCNQIALNSLKDHAKQLKNNIKMLEKELKKIMKEYFLEDYKLLEKVPAIGLVSTAVIIGMLGSYKSFEKANQVISFIGTSPVPNQSGTTLHKTESISKQGNGYIRRIFFLYHCQL